MTWSLLVHISQGPFSSHCFSFSCRNDYKDYSLQNRLHFRIHAAQTEMKQEKKEAKKKAKKQSAR